MSSSYSPETGYFSLQKPKGLEITLGGAEAAAENRRAGYQAGWLYPSGVYMTFKSQAESTTTASSEHEVEEQEAGEEETRVRQDLGRSQWQAWEPLHSTLLVQPHSLPFPIPKGHSNNRKRNPGLGLLCSTSSSVCLLPSTLSLKKQQKQTK